MESNKTCLMRASVGPKKGNGVDAYWKYKLWEHPKIDQRYQVQIVQCRINTKRTLPHLDKS